MMKRKTFNLYDLPEYTERVSRGDQAFWTKDAVLILLVLGLSLLDAVTLYTVFDQVMYQSQVISIILTLGCAISLNFIPLIAARFIHYYRYGMNGVRLWMLIAIACVFLALFAGTFNLRWKTRELSFSGMESSMVDFTGQASGLESTDVESKEAVAITILLGIMPAITSAINLALGYFNDDPIKKKLDKMKYELDKLKNHRDIMHAARIELEQDWQTQLDALDLERRQCICSSIRETTDQIKALARHELAKKLRDPDSISALTEPKLSDIEEKTDSVESYEEERTCA